MAAGDLSMPSDHALLLASDTSAAPPDAVTLGVGFGQDYGGIGLNMVLYPVRPIGFFLGAGYALAGFGFNGGLKMRIVATEHPRAYMYFTGMYGYNAAINVKGKETYNKIFNGFSFGVGMETNPPHNYGGRFSISLIIPVRKPEVQEYINSMKSVGVTFKRELSPVTISLGYRIPAGPTR